MIQLYNKDCLEQYTKIKEHSIDMILCDPPYGTTSLSWDEIIPFDKMWTMIHYLIKPNANVILFGNNPFTSKLIMSNIEEYKQHLIWDKRKGSNPLLAKKRIMQSHEDIILFNKGKAIYNPQMTLGKPYKGPNTGGSRTNSIVGSTSDKIGFKQKDNNGTRYPLSILYYPIHCGSKLHPTQKPTELLSYLINTYSNPGHTVLDFCMGSGSTGVSCLDTNRNFIGIELNKQYFDIAENRILSNNRFKEINKDINPTDEDK